MCGEGIEKLTTARANSVSKPSMYRANRTLYLNIAKGGSKSWIQRVAIAGRRHDIGFGPFPLIGLAEARRRAFANRVAIAEGHKPLTDKRKVKVPTFREAAVRTFETSRPRWRNNKTTVNWMQGMEKRVFPVIGDLPVDRIGREDVLRILTPIWAEKPEIARKLRERVRATLRWTQAHGHVEHNVVGEAIAGALPAMPRISAHFCALPYREVAAALETVDASSATLAGKLCLRFLVLTAARSGEARGARWSEFDDDAGLWVIPESRMKGGAEHRQPLSDAALAVLERARALDDGSGLIFPSPRTRGRPMSDMTLTKILRTTGLAERAVVYGFRSSFRDFASERTNTPHAEMKLSLAHAVGFAVEQAYARSNLLEKRRALMQRWADFVTATGADVVQLHG